MSSPAYAMNGGWNQPQLEHEYPLEPTMFDATVRDPRQPSQQPSQPSAYPNQPNSSFSSYPSTLTGGNDHRFTFTNPQTFNNGPFFNGQPTTESDQAQKPQQQAPFNMSSPMYSNQSPPLPHQAQATTSHTTFDPNAHYQFQTQPTQPPMINTRVSPFDANASNHAMTNGYGSPPSQHYGMYQDQNGMDMQGVQHTAYGVPNDASPDLYGHPAKRQRQDDGQNGFYEAEGDVEQEPRELKQPPSKLGACSRCKGLKVKCEFKTDPDICKRCLNGGHDCIIPGRKKRRAPPKREHLLKQIQGQAEQIKSLIAQLEEANRKVAAQRQQSGDAPSPTTTNTDLYSTLSMPTTGITSPDSEDRDITLQNEQVAKPDVLDWIAKARESLEQFGGYISMGGPGATRAQLNGDGEDETEDGSTSNDEDEYEFAVEDADGDGPLGSAGLDGDHNGAYLSENEGSLATRRPSATEKLAILPSEAAPFGLMANLSLKMTRRRRSRPSSEAAEEGEEVDALGIPNKDFFRSSPAPERPIIDENQQHPHILKNGIVTPAEVENLFKIYWDYINVSIHMLDPELYTPQKTFWRSPFLFTAICAVASKFYVPKPELYQQAMHYARLAAGTALIGGRKSVEVVQAYLLLYLHPMPCRRWEEDRSWVYLGLAIRIASALNLHLPNTAKPRDEQHAREMLNRTRTWLSCFCFDRSAASQYGKPPMINNSDYTANHCDDWWNGPYNMKGHDIHISAYCAELRIMGDFSSRVRSDANSPAGVNKNLDIAKLASDTDDEIAKLWETWVTRVRDHCDPQDPMSNFRTSLLELGYSYARLITLSFGLQYAFGKKATGNDTLLMKCYRAATDVVKAFVTNAGAPHQRIYLRHGPEAQSIFVTFASTFLIKLLQPRFSAYINRAKRIEIRSLIQSAIDLLGGPEVSVDDRHYPKLYSRFLGKLLDTPFAQVDLPPPLPRIPSAQRKAKTASPTAFHRQELHNALSAVAQGSLSSPASPRPQSSSPPPQKVEEPFDFNFGLGLQSSSLLPNDLSGEMNTEFFTPFPIEPDLLHSMQSVTSDPEWDSIMPGFAWMQNNDQDQGMALNAMTMSM